MSITARSPTRLLTALFSLALVVAGCSKKPSDVLVKEAAKHYLFFGKHIAFCANSGSTYTVNPVLIGEQAPTETELENCRVKSLEIRNSYTQTRNGETFYIYEFSADYDGLVRQQFVVPPSSDPGATGSLYQSARTDIPDVGTYTCSDSGTFSLVHRGKYWYYNENFPLGVE